MDANLFGRSKRMYGAVGVGIVLLAAAVGWGRARGDVSVAGAETAAAVDAAGSLAGGLVELQRGLPTGHPASWYTERLAELEYRIASLSYDENGLAVYRVVKAADEFDVRIAMDERDDAARSVEISPLPRQAADSLADAAGIAEAGVLSPEASRVAFEEPGSSGAPASAESISSRPEPRPEPVDETRARKADAEPRIVGTRAPEVEAEARVPESRSPQTDVPPRLPEPAVERTSAPPPPPRYVVKVPAGSRIATRLDGRLSSGDAAAGDAFSMTLREAVWVDDIEVLPAGARVWGRVVEVERAGRPNKGGRIVLAAEAVQIGSDELPLDGLVTAAGESLQGRDSTHEDVKEVAVGAGLGGLVGGLLGGKKGVLIGVLAGGGGTFVATKGEEVELPENAELVVELRRDLEVTFIGRD